MQRGATGAFRYDNTRSGTDVKSAAGYAHFQRGQDGRTVYAAPFSGFAHDDPLLRCRYFHRTTPRVAVATATVYVHFLASGRHCRSDVLTETDPLTYRGDS